MLGTTLSSVRMHFLYYPLLFGVSLDQAIAFQPRKPLDPEDPVELVDLVLVANREKPFGLFELLGAVEIPIDDADLRVTLDFLRHAGREMLPSRWRILSLDAHTILGLT